ncbi:guanylate-binding protein 6-like [Lingula anatina]|uniref:Guanylate-binding protein 6-like n=1 Tax=Lingula anatina TaxID=7574 RepID=A0A1S3K3M5_LINAN|nr:guanylate-binding protein 6-like [Lingula anatina]|eukprot:XP_013417225.1 guanylate-binding protein 6-like [Lingula anatina]
MVGEHDAFELGNEMNAKTLGIWMGTKVLRNREKGFTAILLDSEGTDAFDSEAANDIGILVMTVLLTSQLIYNTKNVPMKRDTEELKVLTDITGKVRVKENEEVTEDMGTLRKMFPNFLWLLRDVHLKFVHPVTKEQMTPTAYVKEVVFKKGTQETAETSQEKIGRVILSAFEQVEAFDLPFPGDTDVLEDIAANADRINPKFNEKIEILIGLILSNLECKRGVAENSKITGDQLATMLQFYVKAVNDPDTIPAMKSAWNASTELRRIKILQDMVSQYNTQMTEAITKVCLKGSEMIPIEERHCDDAEKPSLMSIHDAVMDNVRNGLNKQLEFFGFDEEEQHLNNSLFLDFNERIVRRDTSQENDVIIGGELFRYLQENRERSRLNCEKVFKSLLDELKKRLNPIPVDYTEEMLLADIEQLKMSYLKQAIGPAKLVVLDESFLSSDMTDFLRICKAIQGFRMEVVEAKRQQEVLALQNAKQRCKLQDIIDESARQKEEHSKALQIMAKNNQKNLEKLQKSQEESWLRHKKKMEDLPKAYQQQIAELSEVCLNLIPLLCKNSLIGTN